MKNTQFTNNNSAMSNKTYLFEKKDGDEVRKKICGNQLEKRLEKEIKKKRLNKGKISKKLQKQKYTN